MTLIQAIQKITSTEIPVCYPQSTILPDIPSDIETADHKENKESATVLANVEITLSGKKEKQFARLIIQNLLNEDKDSEVKLTGFITRLGERNQVELWNKRSGQSRVESEATEVKSYQE